MMPQDLSFAFTQVFWWTVPFLVVLGVVVLVHELGHFLAARALGIKVETFSIGFGPEIAGFHDRSGTRWRLAWIPLGGYVKFKGGLPGFRLAATSNSRATTASPACRPPRRWRR